MATKDQTAILEGIKLLDQKIDSLKEEILVNREDMQYVKDLRATTTIEQYRIQAQTIKELNNLKSKGLGFILGVQAVFGVVVYFANRYI